MSRVVIRQKHNKSDDEVREIIEDVEKTLISRYDVRTRWRANEVRFSRPGIDGELCMEPGCVVIRMKLGIMLGIYSRTIQTELERVVAEKLSK
jgi:putative polyhydroxyalkanoate system protein